MDQKMQMAIGPAMEGHTSTSQALGILSTCWDACYDSILTREELTARKIPEQTMQRMQKCQHKCVARNFEVMGVMMSAREQRMKEQQLGLAPGSLASE